MPSLTLEELSGGVGQIIADMLEDRSVKTAVNVPASVAVSVAYTKLKSRVEREASEKLAIKLGIEAALFHSANGEYPTDKALQEDYESALDDVCEKVMESYQDVLTADFLARYTIDSRLHEENGVNRIAEAFGKQVWQSLTWFYPTQPDEQGRPMTQAETLEACGVTNETIKGALDARVPVSVETQQEARKMDIEDVVKRIRASYDKMDIATRQGFLLDAIETVLDNDDGLAVSAAKTTWFGSMEDVKALRAFASGTLRGAHSIVAFVEGEPAGAPVMIEHTPAPAEDDWMAQFSASVEHLSDGTPIVAGRDFELVDTPPLTETELTESMEEPAAEDDWLMEFTLKPGAVNEVPGEIEVLGAPPNDAIRLKPSRRRGAPLPPALPANVPGGVIPAEILLTLKTATGARDEDMAAAVGLSRPTWNNYVKGKAHFTADAKQREAMRAFALDRQAQLQKVLDVL